MSYSLNRPFTITDATIAAGIGVVYICLISLIKEPHRPKISALNMVSVEAVTGVEASNMGSI